MDPELERALEKSWAGTCRALFGRELGGLGKYEDYLSEYLLPVAKRRSHASGKEVIVARDAYPQGARFISEDELTTNREYGLNINEIKDIDSLVAALREKLEYSGNRYLGNSAHVEKSDIILDSQFVYNSTNIEQSSHIHSSFMIRRGSKHVFGSGYTANGEHLARVVAGINLHRCFESHFLGDSSDIYFSFNCVGCHDLLFSFGQKNQSHLIGNLRLPKEKFRDLKAKLLAEIAEELEKNGRYPSLYELCPKGLSSTLPKINPQTPEVGSDVEPVERGFASTYSILFRKQPRRISELEGWLGENTIRVEEVKTAFGTTTCIPLNFGMISEMPRKRTVRVFDALELGKLALDEREIGSVSSIQKGLDKIAYFTSEFWAGENRNVMQNPIVLSSVNIYKGFEATYSENTAMTSISLHSKYVYGCNRVIESQFSLKSYNSLYLNRCFELDGCLKCSDSYFCHNSEALQDCMFCFNMKGRRHHIGNTPLDKETYAKTKGILVGQIADEIDKTKSLKWNIYNIGAMK